MLQVLDFLNELCEFLYPCSCCFQDLEMPKSDASAMRELKEWNLSFVSPLFVQRLYFIIFSLMVKIGHTHLFFRKDEEIREMKHWSSYVGSYLIQAHIASLEWFTKVDRRTKEVWYSQIPSTRYANTKKREDKFHCHKRVCTLYSYANHSINQYTNWYDSLNLIALALILAHFPLYVSHNQCH